MKIALYPGSFNPFHNGHLFVVKTALNDFKMDKIIIVPTMQNPWKEEKALDFIKRVYIIQRYFSEEWIVENYGFYSWREDPFPIEVSEIEKELIPPYYSYATLHALKNKYCNDEIFVLCGEDTIGNIPNWMHGGKIIEDYDFLIVDRPKENIFSSTNIRNRVKEGKSIKGLVNDNVIDLIKNYYKE